MGFISFLQRLGLLPCVSKATIEDAGTEDVIRSSVEHSRAVNGVECVTAKNHHANDKLRDSIRRVRSTAFAEFESSVRRGGGFPPC